MMPFKNEEVVVEFSEKTLQEYLKYSNEILIKLHEKFEQTQNEVVLGALKVLSFNELYYHLQYHQKIIINFLYLKQPSILTDFFISSYRVFLYKGVEADFFKLLYTFFTDVASLYLYTSDMIGITKIYDFLEKNHHQFIELSKEKPVFQEDEVVTQLYDFAINLNFEEGVNLCESYCEDIEGFNHFFSTKIAHLMQLVGYRWEIGKISFAQEHKISSYVDSLLEYFHSKFKVKNGKKNYTLIVLNAPNEEHTLATKLIVSSLSKLGHNVLKLDKELPCEYILKTIHKVKPDFVAFSVTLSSNIYPLIEIVKQLNEDVIEKDYKIVVGGRALQNLEKPLKKIKADLYFETIEEFIKYFEIV